MEQDGPKLSRKNKRKKPSRGDHARSKSLTTSSPISIEAIASSLRSSVLGNIDLDDAELSELTSALSQRHENCLRIRRGVADHPFTVGAEVVPWFDQAVWVDSTASTNHRVSRTLEYATGDFYLQDAGSLLALAIAQSATEQARDENPLAGKLVLDLCAAPGGKASGLLEAIDEPFHDHENSKARGFLLANEPIGSRVAPLAYNLSRTGCDQYAITSLDPETLAERLPSTFDVVVVDAPCSGLALVARGKQSATAVAESQISLNAARQRRILQAAVRLLKPGGRLVYSTCTFAVAENEEQIRFLVDVMNMHLAPVQALVNYASPLMEACYRLWPHRHRCAGSFAASLKKADPDDGDIHENRRQDYWTRIGAKAAAADDAIEQLPFLFGGGETRDQQRDWIIDRFAKDAPDWISEDYVHGPELAYRTGSTWKPSHAAALRDAVVRHVPQLELSDEIAKCYLAGEAIPATDRGWQVVTRQSRPLGWIKGDGRIGKNHLPAHARMTI